MRQFIHSINSSTVILLVSFAPLYVQADDQVKPAAEHPTPTIAGEPTTVSAHPKESVSHLILFQGPKDIVNDWMINNVLQQDITLSDPPNTITQEYVLGGTNTVYRKSAQPTPYRIFVKGMQPARDNGIIVALELKSDKEISKAELEDLFVKYLKAVDQKLMVPAEGIETDMKANKDLLTQQIDLEKQMMNHRRQEAFSMLRAHGTSVTADALSNYEMDLRRDVAKNYLETDVLNAQMASLKKSIADGSGESANDQNVDKERSDPSDTLLDLEAARKAAARKLGDNHPDVKAIDEKIRIYKTRMERGLVPNPDAVKKSLLIEELNLALKNLEASKLKHEHFEEQMAWLHKTKDALAETENIKSRLDLETKAAEERIATLQKQLLDLDDVSYHIIRHRFDRTQMGMITILDPAPTPKPPAQEAKPAEEPKPAEEKSEKP